MIAKNEFLSLMAIGDAYGMRVEFVDHAQIIKDLTYAPHPKFHEYKPGHYTDDTQMSLANAELLVGVKLTQGLTDDDFIAHWMTAFKRDPHLGYSQHMYKTFSEARNVVDFKSRIDGRGVTGGGAMRAAPFGLLPNLAFSKLLCAQQATITHNTDAGINSALAVMLATHFLHHGGKKAEMMRFIQAHMTPAWNAPENGYTGEANNGLKIVTQALDVVMKSKTLTEILLNGVNYARKADTDTVCAIAMAVASRTPEIKNDLPQFLYEKLENGPYGMAHLQAFDQALLQRFPAQNIYPRWTSLGGPTSSPA